ncbi:Yip1 domain protein [Calidithermus terrae]|uniref:Yip1 domain protein n=1 Tax=Calidithermus terrae TaxID=1408545 RepID=A0A399ELS1_9DEIN|nr:YIP1 family protein [Calidithermus terrae]RIH84360.1 Yip1 domain protein [Calidithermus terrae]
MLEVLTQPVRFFAALQGHKPNRLVSVTVVVVATVLVLLSGQLSSRLLPTVLPDRFAGQVVVSVALGIPSGLVFWALGGAVIRLLAGRESRAWELFGWAWAPMLVLALVSLPLAALMPVTGDLPPPPAPTDAEALRQWQRQYQEVIAAAPVTRVQQGLSLVTTLWSLWIVYSGLRVLAPARALLATGVVAALSLGLLAWSLR